MVQNVVKEKIIKDKEVVTLLKNASNNFHVIPEHSGEIYEILLKTTSLHQELLKSTGYMLSTADIKKAVDDLFFILKNKHFPPQQKIETLNLVKIWLNELDHMLDEASGHATVQ